MVAEPSRRAPRVAYLPAALWSVLLAVLLLAPGSRLPRAPSLALLDKVAHAALFAVETVLVARAATAAGAARPLLAAAAVAGVYALVLELAQNWVPGRVLEAGDVVAGLAGVALAAVVLAARERRARGGGGG